MRQFALFIVFIFFIIGCGDSGTENPNKTIKPKAERKEKPAEADPKGVGKYTSVELNNPLNTEMVAAGKTTYEVKCAACHKLTDKRVVGPGWAGVTERRSPEWIMNMVTNVEEMLAKDPEAKKQLKECLVRMPNQNLSDEDARAVLEFMYKNDEGK